jgi:hypothetical protein
LENLLLGIQPNKRKIKKEFLEKRKHPVNKKKWIWLKKCVIK